MFENFDLLTSSYWKVQSKKCVTAIDSLFHNKLQFEFIYDIVWTMFEKLDFLTFFEVRKSLCTKIIDLLDIPSHIREISSEVEKSGKLVMLHMGRNPVTWLLDYAVVHRGQGVACFVLIDSLFHKFQFWKMFEKFDLLTSNSLLKGPIKQESVHCFISFKLNTNTT